MRLERRFETHLEAVNRSFKDAGVLRASHLKRDLHGEEMRVPLPALNSHEGIHRLCGPSPLGLV